MLKKIKKEDLIFSGEIKDDRTNTYLRLNDYDWMNYVLETKFKTEEQGVLMVKFEYSGFNISHMKVKQLLNSSIREWAYEFHASIFQKNIIKFLEKHIKSWDSKYTFNGEDEVIAFFNEVLEKGALDTKES